MNADDQTMLPLRDHEWSTPGVVDGQKTPALKLLESPDFNQFSDGKGLQIMRLAQSSLDLENAPGWVAENIPPVIRQHLPDRSARLARTKGDFVRLLSEQYYDAMSQSAECFASFYGAPAPGFYTDFVLLWDDIKWPLDWACSYPTMFLGHSRVLGPGAISEAGFSLFDVPDGEFLGSEGAAGEPFCIRVSLDPNQPEHIVFSDRLPALDPVRQNEVVLLADEILNTAAVAWRTRSRSAALLRLTEYIAVSYQASSPACPVPRIGITNVQHDAHTHEYRTRHPWAFTFLNNAMRNLSQWFERGGPSRIHPGQLNALYFRPRIASAVEEASPERTEATENDEESSELRCSAKPTKQALRRRRSSPTRPRPSPRRTRARGRSDLSLLLGELLTNTVRPTESQRAPITTWFLPLPRALKSTQKQKDISSYVNHPRFDPRPDHAPAVLAAVAKQRRPVSWRWHA